jgi:SAM-dependent methyltransferase
MSGPAPEGVYDRPEVVARYADLQGLTEPERLLFDAHLRPGMSILDLGVGGGRTTAALAARASRYVGGDLSEAMVRRCRERFPALDFRVLDAADLSAFAEASFDAVVFSFNGLDCLPGEAARTRCLAECARVLKPGGVFVFSSHNPRYLVFAPVLAGRTPPQAAGRLLYAAAHTLATLLSRLPRRAFWRGFGPLYDPATEGGLTILVASPQRVRAELERAGLELARVVGSAHPRRTPVLLTPWYYYAALKPGGDAR